MAGEEARDIPIQNIRRHTNTKGSNSNAGVSGVPVRIVTASKGMMDINRFIAQEITFVDGYIYLGTYTLVIRAEFITIEINPCPTASEKKLKRIIPVNR